MVGSLNYINRKLAVTAKPPLKIKFSSPGVLLPAQSLADVCSLEYLFNSLLACRINLWRGLYYEVIPCGTKWYVVILHIINLSTGLKWLCSSKSIATRLILSSYRAPEASTNHILPMYRPIVFRKGRPRTGGGGGGGVAARRRQLWTQKAFRGVTASWGAQARCILQDTSISKTSC